MTNNHPLAVNHRDHDFEGMETLPYQHEVDGCPTSEPCPGITDCADCSDVIASIVEDLGVGTHLAATHEIIVHADGTYTVLAASDFS